VNYLKFKCTWRAYQQICHSMVGKGNHLVDKTLRENCVSGDAQKMTGKVENLAEIWDIGHLLQETGKVHGQSLIAHSRVQKIQDSG
jgi:hypothetical protein